MRIARTGRLVPTAARGHVTGRHRHVINLRLSDTDGAYLVSLVTRRADWTELALELVDDGIAPEWSTLVAVDDGTAATITDGHVDLGSRRVAEKVGFEPIALMRGHQPWHDGTHRDALLHTMHHDALPESALDAYRLYDVIGRPITR